MNQLRFSLPFFDVLERVKKSPDRIVLDLRIAPLWCKRQGGFALGGRGWKVESTSRSLEDEGLLLKSPFKNMSCFPLTTMIYWGEKTEQSKLIHRFAKKNTFFHMLNGLFFQKSVLP